MKDTNRRLGQHLVLQHKLEQVKREVGNLVPHLPDEVGEIVVHRAEMGWLKRWSMKNIALAIALQWHPELSINDPCTVENSASLRCSSKS